MKYVRKIDKYCVPKMENVESQLRHKKIKSGNHGLLYYMPKCNT